MPNMVDIAVGKRVKHLRWLNGMTQQQLADKIGVKFQQVQKYETGANRISASRLFFLSVSLNVPVSFFFEGIEGSPGTGHPPGFSEADNLYERGSVELLRAYQEIDEAIRPYVLDLLKAVARRSGAEELPREMKGEKVAGEEEAGKGEKEEEVGKKEKGEEGEKGEQEQKKKGQRRKAATKAVPKSARAKGGKTADS